MLQENVKYSSEIIDAYFNAGDVEFEARTSKFVQRESQKGLTGLLFLQGLVFGFIKNPQASLNQLCQTLFDIGVDITAQGLDQRINPQAVAFLKQQLAQALTVYQGKQREISETLRSFTNVYFLDSTLIPLPDELKDVFPAFNTKGAEAAIKIQLLFNFLTGQVTQLAIVEGKASDNAFQTHLPWLTVGSLLIQDLGYFRLDTLQTIAQQGACFLTRWYMQTAIYQSVTGERIDLLSFLRQQEESAGEYAIELGVNQRIQCRMVYVKLPQEIVDQRRRKAKDKARKRGATPSKEQIALLAWNIFLTNAPVAMLSLRQILVCYSLRWQIELIFKLWKSGAALKHLSGIRKERILVELYAKMIGIVLFHFLFAPFRFLLHEQGVELSPVKGQQILKDRVKDIHLAMIHSLEHLEREILILSQRILRFAHKTKRKTRLSTYDKLSWTDNLEICELYPLA
jgi:hypothetical protein